MLKRSCTVGSVIVCQDVHCGKSADGRTSVVVEKNEPMTILALVEKDVYGDSLGVIVLTNGVTACGIVIYAGEDYRRIA